MNLTVARIFSRSIRYAPDKKTYSLSFGNVNTQTRCKTYIRTLKAMENNKYRKGREPIDFLGYCLLGIPITTFALGTWQIKRRKWKLNLMQNMKERIAADPIDLPLNLDELKDKEYYPMRVKGTFLYEKELLLGPKSLIRNGEALSEKQNAVFSSRSNTGYYVITPFKLEDQNVTILVNRGWIPRAARLTYKKTETINESIEIIGIIRTTEKRPIFMPSNSPASGVWCYRDLDALAEVTEAKPVYIELLPNYGVAGGPIGGQTKLTLRNEHLSYIITWYSLSFFTGYMWYRNIIQKLPMP